MVPVAEDRKDGFDVMGQGGIEEKEGMSGAQHAIGHCDTEEKEDTRDVQPWADIWGSVAPLPGKQYVIGVGSRLLVQSSCSLE